MSRMDGALFKKKGKKKKEKEASWRGRASVPTVDMVGAAFSCLCFLSFFRRDVKKKKCIDQRPIHIQNKIK